MNIQDLLNWLKPGQQKQEFSPAPLPDLRLVKELSSPTPTPLTPAPLGFGDFRRIENKLTPPPLAPVLPPAPAPYVVQKNDNLWNISKSFTGNGANWPALYQENKDIIGKNPSLIFPDQKLKLPPKFIPGPVPSLPSPQSSNLFSSFGSGIKPKYDFSSPVLNTEPSLAPKTSWADFRQLDTVSNNPPMPSKLGPDSQLRQYTPTLLEELKNALKGPAEAFKAGGMNSPLVKGLSQIFTPKPENMAYGPEAAPPEYQPQNLVETIAKGLGEQVAEWPVWLAGEAPAGAAVKGIAKLAPELPKIAPKLIPKLLPALKSAGKNAITAAFVSPVESRLTGENQQQALNRAKTLIPSAVVLPPLLKGLGTVAGKGVRAVSESLNAPGFQDLGSLLPKDIKPEPPKLTPNLLFSKPLGPLKVNTPEQLALRDWEDGVNTVRNYIQHDDVLATYPPGTTIQQALSDIKTKTGVDLASLAARLDSASKAPQALGERFTPERAKLGRVAGVIPGPKDTRLAWPELKPNTPRLGESPFPQATAPQLGLTGGPKIKLPKANAEVVATVPKLGFNPFAPLNPLAQPKPLAQAHTLPNPLKPKPLGALPGKMEYLGNGQKARSFPLSLANSEFINTELKAGIASNVAPEAAGAYTPVSLSFVDQQAKSLVDSDLGKAVDFVLNGNVPSALHTATGIRAIERLQNEGNYGQAVDVSMTLADRLTKQGQAISAARIVGALSPEGILTFASRQVQKINAGKLIGRDVQISPEAGANLRKLAEIVQNATDDNMKLEASQELQAALHDLTPSGIGRKIASTQTIGQLANPKTQVRNILGNELFYRLERINKYLATPIDWARSALTGADRTVTFHNNGQGGYWDGFLKGATAGWKGVNPNGLSTQYDLGKSPAFDRNGNAAEKFMSFMERSLGAVMKGFDNAAYTRAYNQTVGELATLKAMNSGTKDKATIETFAKDINDNIRNIADEYGKYITFQDNNVISNGLSAIKRGLNKPTGGDFGLGDIIIKYPKTPGALIARGLEYSPAGFLRSAYLIAQSKGMLKGTPDPREATLALSRAITGTAGLTGLGYFLADNGIISGSGANDKDLAALQKQAGQGPFRVNLTALSRWAMNKFDPATAKPQPGDTIINYDWAQPVAMALSMGANMNQTVQKRLGAKGAVSTMPATFAGGLEGALNTVAEQPVLQGVTRLFQGYDLGSNLTNTLKGVPSSFVPTLFNQVRQATDNASRVTHDPNPLAESLNRAKAKIPGVANTLPPAFDSLGNKRETYQKGSNNLPNVFLNPAFVSKYNVSPEAKKVLNVYDETGSTTQIPRVPQTSITISGKNIDLTTEEYSKYQQLLGEATQRGLAGLSDGSSDAQIKAMVKILNKSNADAKSKILRERGINFYRSGDSLSLTKKK